MGTEWYYERTDRAEAILRIEGFQIWLPNPKSKTKSKRVSKTESDKTEKKKTNNSEDNQYLK
jgi:hypothetical protein